MKKHLVIFVMIISCCFVHSAAVTQTLYNNVGHIPQSYQEPWTSAGLLSEASLITPLAVYVVTEMPGGDIDEKVSAAIDSARTHVSSTNGLGLVYFPEGDFYLTESIELDQNDKNIVFQGAGSDKTTLVFQNLANEHCFSLAGSIDGSWVDLIQSFNKGDSVIHAASGGLSSFSVGDWVHFVQYNFNYNTEHEGFLNSIVGQVTQIEAKGTDGAGDWGELKDVANLNYTD